MRLQAQWTIAIATSLKWLLLFSLVLFTRTNGDIAHTITRTNAKFSDGGPGVAIAIAQCQPSWRVIKIRHSSWLISEIFYSLFADLPRIFIYQSLSCHKNNCAILNWETLWRNFVCLQNIVRVHTPTGEPGKRREYFSVNEMSRENSGHFRQFLSFDYLVWFLVL